MTFAGIGKIQDRANLIAYLRTMAPTPLPLPEVTEAPAAEATTEAAAATEPAATEAATAETTEAAAVDPAALLKEIAAGDVAAGQNVAKKCATCHTFDDGGANKVGPNLWEIVNRPVATHEGFTYSDAMHDFGGEWTLDRLHTYLADPKATVPGTKMNFAGIRKDSDIINLLAYLRTLSANPVPLE